MRLAGFGDATCRVFPLRVAPTGPAGMPVVSRALRTKITANKHKQVERPQVDSVRPTLAGNPYAHCDVLAVKQLRYR
jgi:hypothetical protein